MHASKAVLVNSGFESTLTTTGEVLQRVLAALVESTNVKLLLGPAVGLLVWCLPLKLDPAAHKAIAIGFYGGLLDHRVWKWRYRPVGVCTYFGCWGASIRRWPSVV